MVGHVARSVGDALPGGGRRGYVPATVWAGQSLLVQNRGSFGLLNFSLQKPASLQIGDLLLAYWISDSNAEPITSYGSWFKPGPYDITGGFRIDFFAKSVTDPSESDPSFGLVSNGVNWWGGLLALRDTEFLGFPSLRNVALGPVQIPFATGQTDALVFASARANLSMSIEGGQFLMAGSATPLSYTVQMLREVPAGVRAANVLPARGSNQDGTQQAIRVMGL